MNQGMCSLGVGCDEAGICYADAVGRPEMCPRDSGRLPEGHDREDGHGAPASQSGDSEAGASPKGQCGEVK